MEGNAGDKTGRVKRGDPKTTPKAHRVMTTVIKLVDPDTHLLMHVRARGHRQGIRVTKVTENRVHRGVLLKTKGERGRVYDNHTEVQRKKQWKGPTYDEYMRARHVKADTPLR